MQHFKCRINKNNEKFGDFEVFKYKFQVPSEYKKFSSDKNISRETEIVLSFHKLDKVDLEKFQESGEKGHVLESCQVYAGLPIYNMGFNFLINADFLLVTSRQGLKKFYLLFF